LYGFSGLGGFDTDFLIMYIEIRQNQLNPPNPYNLYCHAGYALDYKSLKEIYLYPSNEPARMR